MQGDISKAVDEACQVAFVACIAEQGHALLIVFSCQIILSLCTRHFAQVVQCKTEDPALVKRQRLLVGFLVVGARHLGMPQPQLGVPQMDGGDGMKIRDMFLEKQAGLFQHGLCDVIPAHIDKHDGVGHVATRHPKIVLQVLGHNQAFLDLRQGGVLFPLPEGQHSTCLKRYAAQRRGCLHDG